MNIPLCSEAYRLSCALKADHLSQIVRSIQTPTAELPAFCEFPTIDASKCGKKAEPVAVSDKQRAVVAAITDVVDMFGDKLPHMKVTNPYDGPARECVLLPTGLVATRKALHELLVTSGHLEGVTLSWFLRCMARFCWHVQLRSWMPFAKCDLCTSLRGKLLACKDRVQFDKIKEEQTAHREYVSVCRAQQTDRENLAVKHPDRFLHICMDGMDSMKTYLPRCDCYYYSRE